MKYVCVCIALLLAGCFSQPTFKIGFFACLTESVVDLSESARNGAIIAIEDANREFEQKTHFELVIFDCPTQGQPVGEVFDQFVDSGVKWVIGPMLSSQVELWKDDAEERGITLISPTATSTQFTGIDDAFWRTTADNKAYAKAVLKYLSAYPEIKNIAVFYDTDNAAYSKDWLDVFEGNLEGSDIDVMHVPFREASVKNYRQYFNDMVEDIDIEVFVIVAESVHTAKFAQLIKPAFPDAIIIGTDASATIALLELGGAAIEGMIHPQPYDFQGTSPAFQAFSKHYTNRFEWQVDFPSMSAYEAMRFVTDNLANDGDITLPKEVEGIQGPLIVDRFGDVEREIVLTKVVEGQFVPVEGTP